MQDNLKKDTVLKVIETVIERFEHKAEVSREQLLQELTGLQQIIIDARNDALSVQNVAQISEEHIPVATDELDAVVLATAEATGTIMDSCEAIEALLEAHGQAALSAAVTDEIIKIYEACSFQDITGQRIRKVVAALAKIENGLAAATQLLLTGEAGSGATGATGAGIDAVNAKAGVSDTSLLNGPQLPQKAMTQSDIDRILKELG
ncbi:MAG: protein phosphatase CheZ [Alphaproteobacteria bacterium]